MNPEPLLVINPLTDTEFVRACDAAMDPPLMHPDELQAALRRRFPNAVVRPRSLTGETVEVWYVYREGHWLASR